VTTKIILEKLIQGSLVNTGNILKAPATSNSKMDYDEDRRSFWNTDNEL